MTDAYLEFVNENSYRRYPLVEDCRAVSVSGVSIPNNLIVDARIVSRRNVPGFYISGYVVGTKTLVIKSMDDKISISIPLAGFEYSSLPARVAASNVDPDYPEYSDVKAYITLGTGVVDFVSSVSTNLEFTALNTTFETSSVIDISGSILNLLGAIRSAPNSSFVVTRDVVIAGGYNTRATQFENTVSVFTDKSGGQLGNYYGTDGQSPCDGIIFSINGVLPDSIGKFSFVQQTGISIEQSAENHSVTISLDTTDMGAAQCLA
jgi:hypothetical protein